MRKRGGERDRGQEREGRERETKMGKRGVRAGEIEVREKKRLGGEEEREIW